MCESPSHLYHLNVFLHKQHIILLLKDVNTTASIMKCKELSKDSLHLFVCSQCS